jgi:hypothetical protein
LNSSDVVLRPFFRSNGQLRFGVDALYAKTGVFFNLLLNRGTSLRRQIRIPLLHILVEIPRHKPNKKQNSRKLTLAIFSNKKKEHELETLPLPLSRLIPSENSFFTKLSVTFSHNFRLSLGCCFSSGLTIFGTTASVDRSIRSIHSPSYAPESSAFECDAEAMLGVGSLSCEGLGEEDVDRVTPLLSTDG